MTIVPSHAGTARRALWGGLAAMLALALLMFPAAVARAQTRVALVIGNGVYQNVPHLPNPPNDARAVREMLERLGFDVVQQSDMTRSAMVRTLRDFGERARGAELALVFYAGHGLQVARTGSTAENYLVPVDARIADVRDVEDEAVSLNRVLERLEGAANRIVILDACRDNPLTRRMTATGGSRSLGSGLALPDVASRGTLVVYATDPGRTAADGTGPHSPFTEALLQHLPTPGIEIRQALTRVRQQVVQSTRGQQTPWNNDGLMQDVFIVRAAPPPPALAVPPPTPGDAQTEIALWQGIQASRDPGDFVHYLNRYPRGLFRELAERRLAALAVPPPAPEPPQPRSLRIPEVQEIQRRLAAMGFDPGPTSGAVGPRLTEALVAYGAASGLDGPPALTPQLLDHLRQEPPPAASRAGALADLAAAALARGDQANAQRLATASLAIAPSGRGHLVAGDLARRAGRSETAREAYRTAAQLGAPEANERLAAMMPPPPPPATEPPPANRPLQRGEITEAQRLLTAMGFETGGTGGAVGPRSQEALQAYLIASGRTLPPGWTVALLEALRGQPPSEDRRARALLTLGRRALDAGNAADAARLFEASLRLQSTPETTAALADARERLAARAPPATPPPAVVEPRQPAPREAAARAPAARDVVSCTSRFFVRTFGVTQVPLRAPSSRVMCRITYTYAGNGENVESVLDTAPRNGTVTIQEGGRQVFWYYSPNDGFRGTDRFVIRLGGIRHGPFGPRIEFDVTVD